MNKFLENISYKNYKLDNIEYRLFICDDCSKKDSEKDFIEKNSNKLPKDLLNLGYISFKYGKYDKIFITTPVMLCPFGVNINKSGGQMSLQFSNYKSDMMMNEFYNFINNLEIMQMKYIGLNEDETIKYVSQIRHDKNNKYDPNLLVKIPFKNNKFEVDIRSDNYNNVSIMSIGKFTKMKCDIYIDKIWLFNDRFYCKWKVRRIYIV